MSTLLSPALAADSTTPAGIQSSSRPQARCLSTIRSSTASRTATSRRPSTPAWRRNWPKRAASPTTPLRPASTTRWCAGKERAVVEARHHGVLPRWSAPTPTTRATSCARTTHRASLRSATRSSSTRGCSPRIETPVRPSAPRSSSTPESLRLLERYSTRTSCMPVPGSPLRTRKSSRPTTPSLPRRPSDFKPEHARRGERLRRGGG